jgi:hypothetical protein
MGRNGRGHAGKDGGKNGDAELEEKKGKQQDHQVLGQFML